MNRTTGNKDQFGHGRDGSTARGVSGIDEPMGHRSSSHERRGSGAINQEVRLMKTKALRLLPVAAALIGVAAWLNNDAPANGGDGVPVQGAERSVAAAADERRVSTDWSYAGLADESAMPAPVDYGPAALPIADAMANARGTANDDEASEKDEEITLAAARAKMSGPVAALARAGGVEPVDLVISYADYPELFDAERVHQLGGEVIRSYAMLAVQTIRLPAAAIDELAFEDNVDRLSLDEDISSVNATTDDGTGNDAGSAEGIDAGGETDGIDAGGETDGIDAGGEEEAAQDQEDAAAAEAERQAREDKKKKRKDNRQEKKSKAKGQRGAANLPEADSPNAVYRGTGITVAVLDTGVSDHGDLAGNVIQYSFLDGAYPAPTIVDGQVVAYNDEPRVDEFGHGTHVAGIIAGSGSGSGNNYRGAATNVTILSLQVLDGHGNGSMSNVMAALDWLLVYGEYFDVKVANLSLGKGISESNRTDPLVHAVEALWDQGVVVIAAAGNLGTGGALTIKSPGNSRKIITVGSLTDYGTAEHEDDYISSFSSRGPSIGDFIMKPDLVAPGNRIVAAIPESAELREELPDRLLDDACVTEDLVEVLDANGDYVCDNAYLELSGTSMSTPLVAAAVALMLDKDPTLNPATIKARLMISARKIEEDPINTGAGVLDVEGALNATGVVDGEALSPRLLVDEVNEGYYIEDTATLWGSVDWAAHSVWADGSEWSADGSTENDGLLWADRNLWADGNLWADRNLWADSNLWADGNLWADSNLWADGNLWADSIDDVDDFYNPKGKGEALDDDDNWDTVKKKD